jgi:hypothetical protein
MRKLVFLAFLLPLVSIAQVESARKTVEKLCSPGFHGRGYVNGGDSIAAEYIASEFKTIGCKFYKKNPFQKFQFQVNTFPNQVSATTSGKALIPGVDFIVAPNCGSFRNYEMHCFVVKTNTLINKDSLQEFIRKTKKRCTAKYSIAYYPAAAKGDTSKWVRAQIQELSTQFPIVELFKDKFTWSVDGEQSTLPTVQLQESALNGMDNYFNLTLNVDAVLRMHTARNVIAYIPAKKRTKKCFVFSAHYDHLGRMGQSTYFPGGNDNASGTAMLIELARYFKEHPGDVNIVFMAFAGEEAGLYGSKHYVDHPLFPLKNIQFLFNLDIMGSGEDGVTIVNGSVFQEKFDLLSSINSTQQFVSQVKIRGKAANSDHYFFSEAGVPAFFMYTMGPNKHYHDVGDTYENLSFNEFNDIFQLLVDFEEEVTKKVKK